MGIHGVAQLWVFLPLLGMGPRLTSRWSTRRRQRWKQPSCSAHRYPARYSLAHTLKILCCKASHKCRQVYWKKAYISSKTFSDQAFFIIYSKGFSTGIAQWAASSLRPTDEGNGSRANGLSSLCWTFDLDGIKELYRYWLKNILILFNNHLSMLDIPFMSQGPMRR